MKNFLLFLTLCLCISEVFSQSVANTWSVKFSDAIMSRWSTTASGGKVCIDKMTSKGWEYSNSIVLHGMEKVYNANITPAYLTYIQTYVDNFVNGSGAFSSAITLNTLDKIHPGIICLFLYEKTGQAKYHTIATTIRNALVGIGPVGTGGVYHRTSNGIYWHKDNASTYDNVVMLDGLYMAEPFLAKYGSLFGDNAAIDTAVNQTLFAYNQLYDPATHLVRHAWTSTPGSYSWDGTSPVGNSNAVWSRAMGWYMMALVDILKYVPAAHPKRAQLITALNNLAIGIANYQDATTGLWYQVVDENGSFGSNFLETSGSAMFVYALRTAAINNWINSTIYTPIARKGWVGLKTYSIDLLTPGDGLPRINNFAPAMSVLDTKLLYANTVSADCPGTNHPHGYAAILMAASVMEFPLGTLPMHFTGFKATVHHNDVSLAWKNTDDNEADYYEIQRSANGNQYSAIGKITSNGSASYKWTDNNVAGNVVYYRIKAVSKTGEIIYSTVLFIKLKSGNVPGMHVSPNPVTGGSVNVLIDNIKPGKYSLRVLNNMGKIIQTKSFQIAEDGVVPVISIPVNAGKGVYYVQLDGPVISINKAIIAE